MSTNHKSGFTLVEIMIVVVIIGLLAAIAIPAFKRVQIRSQHARLASDLRMYSGLLETYAIENGSYPENADSGVIPDGLKQYAKLGHWQQAPSIGGEWDVEKDSFSVLAAIGVHGYTVSEEQLLDFDHLHDDGNLTAGNFRQLSSDRYYYVVPE